MSPSSSFLMLQPNQQQQAGVESPQRISKNSTDDLNGNYTLMLASQQPIPFSLQRRITKTKLCIHYLNGRCYRATKCSFAHFENELRQPPDLSKTKLCTTFMETGCCSKREQCRFAHGIEELRSTPEFYKTALCPFWSAKAFCSAGHSCRWAHGSCELRPRPVFLSDDNDHDIDTFEKRSHRRSKTGPQSSPIVNKGTTEYFEQQPQFTLCSHGHRSNSVETKRFVRCNDCRSSLLNDNMRRNKEASSFPVETRGPLPSALFASSFRPNQYNSTQNNCNEAFYYNHIRARIKSFPHSRHRTEPSTMPPLPPALPPSFAAATWYNSNNCFNSKASYRSSHFPSEMLNNRTVCQNSNITNIAISTTTSSGENDSMTNNRHYFRTLCCSPIVVNSNDRSSLSTRQYHEAPDNLITNGSASTDNSPLDRSSASGIITLPSTSLESVGGLRNSMYHKTGKDMFMHSDVNGPRSYLGLIGFEGDDTRGFAIVSTVAKDDDEEDDDDYRFRSQFSLPEYLPSNSLASSDINFLAIASTSTVAKIANNGPTFLKDHTFAQQTSQQLQSTDPS